MWLHICLMGIIIVCFAGMFIFWPWRDPKSVSIAKAIRRDLARWRVEDELARWRDVDQRMADIRSLEHDRQLEEYSALLEEAERFFQRWPRQYGRTPQRLARKYWERKSNKVNWLKEGF